MLYFDTHAHYDWEEFDEEGYSLWYMEYENLPNECKILYKSCNFK